MSTEDKNLHHFHGNQTHLEMILPKQDGTLPGAKRKSDFSLERKKIRKSGRMKERIESRRIDEMLQNI